jgi:hypothetical protein
MNLRAGDRVKVLDAFGTWHDATADSDVEHGHKFRIVWVFVDGWPDDRMPWPVDSLKLPAGTAMGA